jgi:signal transduction histidine kinase/ActR/RegA family two-component response regulator
MSAQSASADGGPESAADGDLDAYRATRDTVVREYPLRLLASAGVAWILAALGREALAAAWWGAMAALLALEAVAFRKVFDAARPERRAPSAGVKAMFAALSFLCALVYTIPVWVLIDAGTTAAGFAAAAFIAGTLIHLTVHNANTHLIYASGVAPMSATFLAAGALIALQSRSFIPMLTVLHFLAAMVAAYLARRENARQVAVAMAEAVRERARAEHASAAKSQFLAKMSHELKTPLNGVIGMAEALRASLLEPERRAQAQAILGSAAILNRLVGETLDHAAIEAGALKLQVSDENLLAIVEETAAQFRAEALAKGVALAVDASGIEEPWLRLDGPRLRQCLSHLVENALKFTDAGAIIVKAQTVRIGDHEARAEIEVSDTGAGLGAEDCARVFSAFEQADNSITRRHGGAGLGLAVARGVARAMEGDLTVRSTPGAGSTFHLKFRADIADAPKAPSTLDDILSARILLVEDNLVNRQVVGALLRPFKVAIVEAENGEQALARLHETRFDVVLMDLHMPVMDGLAATRAIRASGRAWAATPIVAVTAAVSEEDRRQSFAAGVDEFLPKPVRPERLVTLIRRFAGESARAASA